MAQRQVGHRPQGTRPHPGAQLRIADVDGHRITAVATNTRPGGPSGQLPELELATAAAAGARIGSAGRRTPAWATSRCMT